jgi:hypothetical protein
MDYLGCASGSTRQTASQRPLVRRLWRAASQPRGFVRVMLLAPSCARPCEGRASGLLAEFAPPIDQGTHFDLEFRNLRVRCSYLID